ncbi:cytochrome P450, cyclodipeptide synthase-associated [Streptomyces sp. D2-8]|uniref:cytochrome P450, cyclodipeptide synthase-associated n=1 Tax=Streptomyces sp. D2-8 TaxID=2707767 RepID=UPI0024A7A188|nr:cytochrome P450, cyclodipeptide synthase-associated [Streptomyces sp. D2-8]
MPLVQPGFSVLSDGFAADPYRHFARLREQAPVHYEPAIDSYFLSRHQDVRRVLTDHQAFTTKTLQARAEPVMRGPVLAQMTGAEHTAKRKIVVRGVTGEALRDQVRAARANAAELLAPLLARGRMDLVNDFGKPFAVHVTLDVLGLDRKDWQQVAAWHSGVAEFITSLALTPERRQHCMDCAGQLEAYLVPVVELRRRRPGADLISRLCTAEFDGVAMSDRDVIALIINVLAAATEPADKTLALLFKHLIDHPDQMAQVRRDPALLPAAIAETLRHTPPVQLVPRQAEKDSVIAGTTVPAGATVFCMIGAANRDPGVFTDPDTFDINRPDLGTARSFTAAAQHLAFGVGLHQCVGAAFARAEIETVTELLLPLLDQVRYSPGFRYRETGLYTRGPVSLQLDFTPVPAGGTCGDRAPSCTTAPDGDGYTVCPALSREPGPAPTLLQAIETMTSTDITRAINDLLFTPGLDLAEAVDRHFAPDYRQRTNGVWSDRESFTQHMARLRSLIRDGHMEVHDELRDGLRYADRHTVTLTHNDGRVSVTEVYLFAEMAPDGRFRRVEETTLLVSGHPDDGNLGLVK